MDFNAIIKRAINVITKPNDEFQAIKGEKMTIADMYVKYAIFLAAIPAIARFIGLLLLPFGTRLFGRFLIGSILLYVLSLGGLYVLAFIIDTLAPNFGGKKDINSSLKIAVFSYTAAWIGGILYIIPSQPFWILAGLAGIYTLYLLYVGMKNLKEVPQDKMVGYYVVTIIAAIIIFFIIGLIVSTIIWGRFGGYFYM